MVPVHGGDIYTVAEQGGQLIADFSANINPLGMPEGVQKAIIGAIKACEHYPDPLCRALSQAIAAYEQLDCEQVVCGNGAADLIFRIVNSLKPERGLILAPTFAEYEQALEQAGCQVMAYQLQAAQDFQLGSGFLAVLDSTLDILFLCNPNNPTGQLIEQQLLLQIIRRCRELEIIVVLDECFIDFLQDAEQVSCVSFLKQFPNLFILKALTKSYALPGLRLGYGLSASRELLATVSAGGQPWSVSVLAQAAGIAALRETAYLARTKALIAAECAKLTAALRQLGLQVYPAQANYIFFRSESVSLQVALLRKGFLIRSCGNYQGLDDHYYRIAVKSPEDNQQLLTALAEVLQTEVVG